MSRAEGLQARRTRMLVRTAATELCEHNGFDGLTVSELVDRAMVSRATFYRYYRDKYDVIEEMFAGAFENLTPAAADDPELRRTRWIEFFEHIAENRGLYKALLVDSRHGWFARHLRSRFTSLTIEHAASGSTIFGDKTPEALSRILASVFAETITWWVANDLPIPPHDVATGAARAAGAIIRDATAHD
jgi:AcrR family transcriptional regulator